MNKKIISCLMFLGLITACSNKKLDYVVTDYSHKDKPLWIENMKKFEGKKDNEGDKYRYFKSEGESINKRLCEKSAISNTNIVIASEINNQINNLYTGLTEVQMEEMLTGDNKREDTENLIKANLVGVELRETYWEKRKYSKELGADKDKSSYYCYQLSRVKRENHDKMISEMLDKELKNIKNNDLKEKIENQIEKNAELNNIDLDD